MNKINRRTFLKASLATSASLTLLPGCKSAAPTRLRVRGANEDIRFAVIGFHGRGTAHIEGMRAVPGTRLVALCDPDQAVLGKELQKCKALGENVTGYTDIRKLLENPDLDAVTIATPNHWHALASIWAIQAGKDVYVEKPVSHNVWEGRQIVLAARKHQRIVQAGTQIRSSPGVQEAILWLREGHLGKILRSRGLCYKRRPSIGKADGPQPVPPSVDYELWCGPAPKGPLTRKRLHYDWHWVWPTGNGDVGNQGIHQMDLARWALGEPSLSPRVLSLGGRLSYEDDGTTPNTQIIFHDYPSAPLIFEVRGLPARAATEKMDSYHGAGIGVVVDCEGGFMVFPSYSEALVYDRQWKEIKQFKGGASHFANFVAAIRSRKETDLHGQILEGHISSGLCHTGNISYQLGQKQSPEQIREAAKANADLAESLGRMEEHLAANQVDLHKTPATLGVALKMDPRTERFLDHPQANQLLTREYRPPFVVPSKV